MKNPLKKIAEKHPALRFLGNSYFLILCIFVVWMLFFDNYSYVFHHRILDEEIQILEDNKKYYQDEIRKDEQSIRMLKSPDQIEKFAREKYYMKRDNEDIFIIEYESDTVSKKTD
jgi:cell division protein DivIC